MWGSFIWPNAQAPKWDTGMPRMQAVMWLCCLEGTGPGVRAPCPREGVTGVSMGTAPREGRGVSVDTAPQEGTAVSVGTAPWEGRGVSVGTTTPGGERREHGHRPPGGDSSERGPLRRVLGGERELKPGLLAALASLPASLPSA